MGGETADIAVIVPVLGRPERVQPLLDSLGRTEGPTVRPVFVASPDDQAELAEVDACGFTYLVADRPAGPGDYARKVNQAVRETREPWVFVGADDLCFCRDWAAVALAEAERTAAAVVGTNDLGNSRVTSGQHATHSLVSRGYCELGTIDGQPGLLCELYDHQFVDDELVATAQHRRTWHFAEGSWVEHLHPNWGKGVMDATYAKGQAHFDADRRLFQQRSRLWSYQ